MRDIVVEIMEAVEDGWERFMELVKQELHEPNGTVKRPSRYASVGAAMRRRMKSEAESIHHELGVILTDCGDRSEVNQHLYMVLFDCFVECHFYLQRFRRTDILGDRVHSMQALDAIAEVLDNEFKLKGNNITIEFWRGILCFMRDDLKGAYQHFSHVDPDAVPVEPFNRFQVGVRTYIHNLMEVLDSKIIVDFPDDFVFLQRSPPSADDEVVILTCCDESYLMKIGHLFFESIMQIDYPVRVHLHVARKNRDDLDISFLDARPPNVMMDITWSDASPYSEKSWFTVIRWILAGRLLDLYCRPLLVTDFDVRLDGKKMKNYFELLSGYDVGVNINKFPTNYIPWNSINANQLYLNNTDIARRFAQLIHDVTLRWYDVSRGDQWWIDQNILYACFRELRSSGQNVRIFNNFSPAGSIKTIIKDKKDYLKKDSPPATAAMSGAGGSPGDRAPTSR